VSKTPKIHLIAIDPAVNNLGLAEWVGELPRPPLVDVRTIATKDLLTLPAKVIRLTNVQRRVAVIEYPYVGKKVYFNQKKGQWMNVDLSKTSITLAVAVGRIQQVFWQMGFEIVEAPTFGITGWISLMLGIGGKAPKTDMVKKLSIAMAKKIYPEITGGINHDEAAAVCMGTWYLDKTKFMKKGG
jgi:hypothetical protein